MSPERRAQWKQLVIYWLRAWLWTHETVEIPQMTPAGERVYLRRWFLRGSMEDKRTRRIMVHEILMSDEGRDLHDHPWDFVSIGVHGSYRESYHDGSHRVFHAPWIRLVRAEQLHRLDLVQGKPVTTIVLTGPKRRDWGFLQGERWVPWREYVGTHGKALEHVQVGL